MAWPMSGASGGEYAQHGWSGGGGALFKLLDVNSGLSCVQGIKNHLALSERLNE